METLIGKLYCERLEKMPKKETYSKLMQEICDENKFMRQTFGNDIVLCQRYDGIINKIEECDGIVINEMFEDGFKCGFKLALEIFDITI